MKNICPFQIKPSGVASGDVYTRKLPPVRFMLKMDALLSETHRREPSQVIPLEFPPGAVKLLIVCIVRLVLKVAVGVGVLVSVGDGVTVGGGLVVGVFVGCSVATGMDVGNEPTVGATAGDVLPGVGNKTCMGAESTADVGCLAGATVGLKAIKGRLVDVTLGSSDGRGVMETSALDGASVEVSISEF